MITARHKYLGPPNVLTAHEDMINTIMRPRD